MRLRRTSRLIAATIMLFSMLFTQLAVAAYACPALSTGHDSQMRTVMAATTTDMSPCHDMDMDQPSLCHASHQNDKQSLDKPAAANPAPFIAIGYGLPVALSLVSFDADPEASPTFSLKRATAPPIAIRNCCFRI